MPYDHRISYIRKYVKYRLAEYLNVLPENIREAPPTHPDADLVFETYTYKIKTASPSIISHHKPEPTFDFDVREDLWYNGRCHKKPRSENKVTHYLLVGLEDDMVTRIFLIPSSYMPSSHVRIPAVGRGKYLNHEI